MPKPLNEFSFQLLLEIQETPSLTLHGIQNHHNKGKSSKAVYDTLFRLVSSGYVEKEDDRYKITEQGTDFIHRKNPTKDGIWKLIIFDIPESKRKVRNMLRQRLVTLGFKKWQYSIWITPYALAPQIEEELQQLAKRFFIRLIKTTDINETEDLEKLFQD